MGTSQLSQPIHISVPQSRDVAPERPSQGGGTKFFGRALLALGMVVAAVGLRAGFAYYRLPYSERPYSELHDLFAPAGRLGLLYGLVGTTMMVVGVALYATRKRFSGLSRLGALTNWLQFHVFLCTLGPFLILLHTGFKIQGIVAIAFWSMTGVALSGLFGRFIYSRVPKSINGRFESLVTVRHQKAMLVSVISRDAGLAPEVVANVLGLERSDRPRGFLHAIVLAIKYDLSKRRQARRIAQIVDASKVAPNVQEWVAGLLQRQLVLEQQIVLLQPFRRLFGLWHLLHLPLAIVMLLIVIAHVAVAFTMGYAWPF